MGRGLLAAGLLAASLAACGGGAAPQPTATPRPILISSTDTPGPYPAPSEIQPAVPNSTALTPFATSTVEAGATASPTPSNDLRVQDFSFAPPTLTVNLGTQLTWTNFGPSNHTVTANDGSFDSGILLPNAKFTFTLSTPGTLAYHCSIHPTMQGTLIVR
ncbi:MAG TPA: cupredoxin domain-containing protein [Chloroflexota bacterium]|nr:cupredoxin domain-containing protein [Chloroflexota bacterium]